MWPEWNLAHVIFLLDNTVLEVLDEIWDLIIDYNFCVYLPELINLKKISENIFLMI